MIPWFTLVPLYMLLTPMVYADTIDVILPTNGESVQVVNSSPQSVMTAPTENNTAANNTVLPTIENARVWQLSFEEWQRYETLMLGDAKYQFSELDPVWVLGIYAESVSERERYVRKFLQLSEQRLQRALAFNESFRQVAIDYFRDQAVLDLDKFYALLGEERPPQHSPVNLPQQGDTLVFFIHPTISPALAAYQRMQDLMNSASGVKLEIYFGGDAKAKDIQVWARQANLSQDKVKNGRITLNVDQGAAAEFEVSQFPAGFIVRDDTALPVDF